MTCGNRPQCASFLVFANSLLLPRNPWTQPKTQHFQRPDLSHLPKPSASTVLGTSWALRK